MTRLAPLPALMPALVLAACALAGCAQPASRTAAGRPSPAVSLSCRQEVDRVYAAQNRRDLSMRDQRDTPFAASYNSGVTTRGLGALYDQDNQYAACVRNNTNGGAAAGAPAGAQTTGPVFSPVGK